MKLLGGILAWVASSCVLTIGCDHRESNYASAVASDLVMRVITADTLQQYDLVADDAHWGECEWVWSSDITRPVGAVKVIDTNHAGNLVKFGVEYTVLGTAISGNSGAGFERGVIRDTVTLVVSVDENGRGRVQCGNYNLNHPGLTTFAQDWVPHLDAASREEWEDALAELGR